jgi:AbrB family looped-hinge helix DNA binding protein
MARRTDARISEGGRVVIPAQFRKAIGLKVGDPISIRLVDKEIRILPLDEAVRRAQALVRKHVPKGRSLVAELHDDRRREADE